mmetsp:Transcript_45983/g.146778  ORF Transcript_45983/g.146778 Transcript_45983/m.146778 type:complete len:245 (-) Transcript_45983:1069-1803(-)
MGKSCSPTWPPLAASVPAASGTASPRRSPARSCTGPSAAPRRGGSGLCQSLRTLRPPLRAQAPLGGHWPRSPPKLPAASPLTHCSLIGSFAECRRWAEDCFRTRSGRAPRARPQRLRRPAARPPSAPASSLAPRGGRRRGEAWRHGRSTSATTGFTARQLCAGWPRRVELRWARCIRRRWPPSTIGQSTSRPLGGMPRPKTCSAATCAIARRSWAPRTARRWRAWGTWRGCCGRGAATRKRNLC